jgi:PqqD family protein of HPr-rel-A system
MKWQVLSIGALKLRSWDDECVVYNCLSGDTHLIGPLAVRILTQLLQAPADTASLADGLQYEPIDGGGLDEILDDLKRLSLIEQVV